MKAVFVASLTCLTLGTSLALAQAPGPLVSLGRPMIHASEDDAVSRPTLGRPMIVRAAPPDPLIGPNAVPPGPPPPPGTPALPPGAIPAPPPPGVGGPPVTAAPCPARSSEAPRVWVTGEYLLWWVKNGPSLPPLIPVGTPAGVNGNALTDLTIRGGAGQSFNYDTFSGIRIGAGGWITCNETFGLEGSFLLLERRSASFAAIAPETGFPGLGPGPSTAGIAVNSNTQLYGFEANSLINLARNCNYHADLIVGFRNLNLDENLSVNTAATTGTLGVPASEGFADAFRTQNSFYGAQVGVRGGAHWGPVSFDAVGKIAFGVTNEAVSVTGVRAAVVGPVAGTTIGGLYAQPSNIGRQTRDPFAVVPEVTFSVGYDVTNNLRVFVGYTFLYISDVVRPGNQVDPAVNVSQIVGPFAGPVRPVRIFRESDFWAQGLNFGVEYHF
jgi:hypothetical protein